MAKTLNDFYNDLGARESGGNYKAVNTIGYLGKYQMGEMAMVDAGYYKPKANRNYNNKWDGEFTGKDGVYSVEDFLNNPIAQENAQKIFKQKQWGYIKDFATKYNKSMINGIEITPSGMLAATHLLGQAELYKYLNSNGKYIPKDGYGTSIEEYLQKFGGYDVSEITGLKSDAITLSPTIPNVPQPNNVNIPKVNTQIEVSPFQVGIEYNEYLPGYLPSFDNLFINPVDNIVLPTNVQKMPDFSDIPFANPLANQGQPTGFAASIVEDSPYQKPIIFTPEQIGKMTREEFDRNESIIMEQLKRGEINPYSPQPNYGDFNNPELDNLMIFTREDIGNMSKNEYAKYEKAINEQLRTVGIPHKRDLPQNLRTYEKEKSQRTYSSNSQDGRWVTINGNHVFIEND